MGYRDTRTEGPAAHAASALLTLFGKRHDLSDVQMLAILTEIAKAVPADHKAPSRRTWDRFLAKARTKVKRADVTEARRASLYRRLDQATAGLPNARLWFALEHLEEITAARAQSLAGYLAQIARIDGRDITEVTTEFRTRHAAAGTARQNGAGRRPRTLYYGHLPSDYGTITTLANMRREALQRSRGDALEHTVLTGGFVDSYGHDPATGRLEVTMAGASYAYRVPRQVAEHLNTLADDGQAASSYLASTVFPNPDYAWNEETDQAVRLCPACGEVVGDIHPCPGPADAPYSDPVLVNLAIGDEIVTPDGTVVLLPPTGRLRAELARRGEVTVPVVVFASHDVETRDVLGGGVTITGEVRLETSGPVDEQLECSCPLAQCVHLDGVANMVLDMVISNQIPGRDDQA